MTGKEYLGWVANEEKRHEGLMKGAITIASWAVRHRGAMSDVEVRIAHLLRRTGFGPHPGQVAQLAAGGVGAALDAAIDARPIAPEPPALGTKDDENLLVRWWLDVMARPDAGLHEKMVWFWHGHITSSLDKTEPVAMWRQHELMRTHALGNARELLHEVTVDAAMLDWLDGNGSEADAPNENHGRELMELFTLGRGNYTEADVRAAAYALSGWSTDEKKGLKVAFDPEKGPQHPVTLLGRAVANTKDVVDAVCDHPAFAALIAGKLYTYFHGVAPDDAVLRRLADGFRAGGLEIRPLVAAILRDPSFFDHRYTRARFPVEWFVAAHAVLGKDGDVGLLDVLGQVPFNPPNVAGWPLSPRWLSAGASMVRATEGWQSAGDTEVIATDDPVAWVLAKASLHEVTDSTRRALTRAAGRVEGKRERASVLHALVVTCPEFYLA